MYPATFNPKVQEQKETILEAGLSALTKITKEEFEGLKLILRILSGEVKINDRENQSRSNT